jgi:hypothetical protein
MPDTPWNRIVDQRLLALEKQLSDATAECRQIGDNHRASIEGLSKGVIAHTAGYEWCHAHIETLQTTTSAIQKALLTVDERLEALDTLGRVLKDRTEGIAAMLRNLEKDVTALEKGRVPPAPSIAQPMSVPPEPAAYRDQCPQTSMLPYGHVADDKFICHIAENLRAGVSPNDRDRPALATRLQLIAAEINRLKRGSK